METNSITYAEIVDFYKILGIPTDESTEGQLPDTPAGWDMPTAFDDTPLVFSNSTTSPEKGLS